MWIKPSTLIPRREKEFKNYITPYVSSATA
jgi:hypothetical protein